MPAPSTEHGETAIGRHPDGATGTVALADDTLGAGVSVAGNVPQRQTELLHEWCRQWAEAGYGFCYVHPQGAPLRDLLARLPDDRLDDVVWIDRRRHRRPDELAVPSDTRVAIEALDPPSVDPIALETDPAVARTNDVIGAASPYREFDWNVARVLSTVLPWVFDDDGPSVLDITSACRDAARAGEMGPVVDLASATERAGVRATLAAVPAHDAGGFRQAAQILSWVQDPYPANPMLGAPTYHPGDAIADDHIVLVAADQPRAETDSPGREVVASHVFTRAILRQLREAGGTASRSAPFPLVLDRCEELVAGDGQFLADLLADAASTPLAPVVNGQPTSALPEPARLAVADHVDTEIVFAANATDEVEAALLDGELAVPGHYLENADRSPIDDGSLCWVKTDKAGLLAGEPARGDVHPVLPRPPRPTERSQSAVARRITASVERFGGEADWLTEEPTDGTDG